MMEGRGASLVFGLERGTALFVWRNTKTPPSGTWPEGGTPWKPGQRDRPHQGSSSIAITKEQSTSAFAALRTAPALAFVVMRIS